MGPPAFATQSYTSPYGNVNHTTMAASLGYMGFPGQQHGNDSNGYSNGYNGAAQMFAQPRHTQGLHHETSYQPTPFTHSYQQPPAANGPAYQQPPNHWHGTYRPNPATGSNLHDVGTLQSQPQSHLGGPPRRQLNLTSTTQQPPLHVREPPVAKVRGKRKVPTATKAGNQRKSPNLVPQEQSDVETEDDDEGMQEVLAYRFMAEAKKHEIVRVPLTRTALANDDWKQIKKSKRTQKKWVLQIQTALTSPYKTLPEGRSHQSQRDKDEWTRWQEFHEKKVAPLLSKPSQAEMRAWNLLQKTLMAHRMGVPKTGMGTDRSSIASVRLDMIVKTITGMPLVALDVMRRKDMDELVANPAGFKTRKMNNLWINFSKKRDKAEKKKLEALLEAQRKGGQTAGDGTSDGAADDGRMGGVREADEEVAEERYESGHEDDYAEDAEQDEEEDAELEPGLYGEDTAGPAEGTGYALSNPMLGASGSEYAMEQGDEDTTYEDDPKTSSWKPTGKRKRGKQTVSR